MTKTYTEKPPDGLSEATRQWWLETTSEFALEPRHLKLLTLCATSWDRMNEAQDAITEHGMVYKNRFGDPKARPEIKIANDSATVFMRALRELGLDVEAPDEKNPPTIRGRGRV